MAPDGPSCWPKRCGNPQCWFVVVVSDCKPPILTASPACMTAFPSPNKSTYYKSRPQASILHFPTYNVVGVKILSKGGMAKGKRCLSIISASLGRSSDPPLRYQEVKSADAVLSLPTFSVQAKLLCPPLGH